MRPPSPGAEEALIARKTVHVQMLATILRLVSISSSTAVAGSHSSQFNASPGSLPLCNSSIALRMPRHVVAPIMSPASSSWSARSAARSGASSPCWSISSRIRARFRVGFPDALTVRSVSWILTYGPGAAPISGIARAMSFGLMTAVSLDALQAMRFSGLTAIILAKSGGATT